MIVKNLKVIGIGKEKFTLEWKTLPAKGLSYIVEFDEGTRGANWTQKVTIENTKERKKMKTEIDGLVPGQSYMVRIVVQGL